MALRQQSQNSRTSSDSRPTTQSLRLESSLSFSCTIWYISVLVHLLLCQLSICLKGLTVICFTILGLLDGNEAHLVKEFKLLQLQLQIITLTKVIKNTLMGQVNFYLILNVSFISFLLWFLEV